MNWTNDLGETSTRKKEKQFIMQISPRIREEQINVKNLLKHFLNGTIFFE